MISDPHFKSREAIVEVDHPIFGSFQMPGTFPKLSKTPGEVSSTAPELGAHNEEILGTELGKSIDEIASLREQGII